MRELAFEEILHRVSNLLRIKTLFKEGMSFESLKMCTTVLRIRKGFGPFACLPGVGKQSSGTVLGSKDGWQFILCSSLQLL